MVLRQGDIPATVRSVTIRNSAHVIVEENAIKDLRTLVSFSVSDTKQLEIRPAGMALYIQNRLRFVTFTNIGSLHASTKAFAGFWMPQTTIQMGNTVDLHIETNAFDIEIDGTGPSISINRVQSLILDPNGLSAQFSTVDILHVNMDECHEGNFGHHSPHTHWRNVIIRDTRRGCFQGLNESSTIDIQGLEVKNMSSGSISGVVHELVIRDSQLGDLQEKALDISVGKVTMASSHFHRLRPLSLSVKVTGYAHLEYLRIDQLQTRALRGVRLVRSPHWAPPRLRLNQFKIITAENGSLTLSTSTERKISASYISVKSRRAPICPNERYLRTLVSVDPSQPLTDAQRVLESAMLGNTLCDEPKQTKTKKIPETSVEVEYKIVEADHDHDLENDHVPGAGKSGDLKDRPIEKAVSLSSKSASSSAGPQGSVQQSHSLLFVAALAVLASSRVFC